MPHFIFIQQISVLNISNMLYNLHFFFSKCRLFHNATLFGFCITHILNTGCAKIWKKKIRLQKLMRYTDRNNETNYFHLSAAPPFQVWPSACPQLSYCTLKLSTFRTLSILYDILLQLRFIAPSILFLMWVRLHWLLFSCVWLCVICYKHIRTLKWIYLTSSPWRYDS